jgi:uncharacterized membrane protein
MENFIIIGLGLIAVVFIPSIIFGKIGFKVGFDQESELSLYGKLVLSSALILIILAVYQINIK